MIQINDVSDLFELEPMKYNTMPASYTSTQRQEKLELLIASGEYLFSEKTDGNLVRAIITPERFALQTRGISKKTGTYGEVQDKVFFADNIAAAFDDTTVLIGEAYIEGGTDKDVGSVLRSLGPRAKKVQTENKIVKYRIFDCFYYEGQNLLDRPIVERIRYLNDAVTKINSPLVGCVKYYNADSRTFEILQSIFDKGGEGIVLYKKSMTPVEGRTSAWQTVKIKQELELDADCFIYGVKPPEKEYKGKEIENWTYWINEKTNEKICGKYYMNWKMGDTISPISRPYYYNWPGSIAAAVYDGDDIKILCYCSNLTDDFCRELSKDYDSYHLRPIRVSGMLLSETVNKDGTIDYSIRHPRFKGLREDGELESKDCTLEKLKGNK